MGKPALGKGIGALLKANTTENINNNTLKNIATSTKKNEVNDDTNYLISLSSIKPNKAQPRKIFKDEELKELASSIKENGVIQPLIVKKIDKGFEIIAGERRYRASKLAGLEQVPVVIKNVTDKERLVISIIENVQRQDLNCVEEALAYFELMSDFKLTQEEVAKKVGKSRATIANFLRVLKLPREVIELLKDDKLSLGHAKVLGAEKDHNRSIRLANLTVKDQLSVRELEKLLKRKDKLTTQENSKDNFYSDEKLRMFRDKLEKRTGFHFELASKKNGSGAITIKFNNEAEFNDVYEFLLLK